MLKDKKERQKIIKSQNKDSTSLQEPNNLIKPESKPMWQLLFTWFGLLAIIFFAIFLRYEDFSVWHKNKTAFQYQGEYQMANFDSYFYLQTAKDLQNGVYDNINERRRVPNGMERRAIPPLLSMLTVSVSGLSGITLATTAIFVPVVLSSLLAIIVFLLCLKLNLGRIPSLTATLFSIISLTHVVRTRVGVFDTDCLNVVFPLITSYLIYGFAQLKNRQRYKYLVLAFINTFLYFIWWNTASSVVILSLVVPLSVAIIFFIEYEKPIIKYSILGLVVLTSLLFIKDQVVLYFKLLFNLTTSSFPNNMDISELNPIDVNSFIEKTTDNQFIIILMLIGFVYFVGKHRLKTLFLSVPILLAISPFVAGNRFIIFSAPIMGLAIGHAVQLLFNYKSTIKPIVVYIITTTIVAIGFFSNYKTITEGFKKPAAYDNAVLLEALKRNTPKQSNIWTDSDLGYQIQYYLDRGTYADGEFSDGEVYYYLYFPLATDNLALAANYMRFYNAHGIKGMRDLYKLFSGVHEAFLFLKNVLSLKPLEAKFWLENQQQNGKLPLTDDLTSLDKWLSFLYPTQRDDIYLLIHYRMTQTASWFKQGNSNLITGKTIGLPLFLDFNDLKEKNSRIKNSQININMVNGKADHISGSKHSFQYILTYDSAESKRLRYTKSGKLKSVNSRRDGNDNRFVFQWNKKLGFGAALSKEIGNTTLVKLYLQNEISNYFEPVRLNVPLYQIWKVRGDIYEK